MKIIWMLDASVMELTRRMMGTAMRWGIAQWLFILLWYVLSQCFKLVTFLVVPNEMQVAVRLALLLLVAVALMVVLKERLAGQESFVPHWITVYLLPIIRLLALLGGTAFAFWNRPDFYLVTYETSIFPLPQLGLFGWAPAWVCLARLACLGSLTFYFVSNYQPQRKASLVEPVLSRAG